METLGDEPSGRARDESEQPARLARRDAKSELAQVRAHHALNIANRTRARQLASSPSGAPGTDRRPLIATELDNPCVRLWHESDIAQVLGGLCYLTD